MKKLALLIVAICILSRVAFSAEFREFNVKVVADIPIKIKLQDQIKSITPKFENVFAGKYLLFVNNLFKPEACLEYLCLDEYADKYTNVGKGINRARTWHLPIYFNAQVNPALPAVGFTLLKEKEILRGERLCLEYPPWLNEYISWLSSLFVTNIAGLYFYPFGITYEFFPNIKIWCGLSGLTLDTTSYRLNISANLGLKFKIDIGGRPWRAKVLDFEFLRHIRRAKAPIHLIDFILIYVSGFDGKDPYENYKIINNELKKYSKVS
jgi:hypothetical protein